MLNVKINLKCSNIHGVGLFAAEEIKKGTRVWEYNSETSIVVNDILIKKYPFIEKYSWMTPEGKFVFDIDDSRHMNHSITPNIKMINGLYCEALIDIKIDEELTLDYKEIMPEDKWEDYYKC